MMKALKHIQEYVVMMKAIKKLKNRGGFSQLLKKEVKEMKSSDRIRNN